jgi:hypothetical protein
MSATESKENSYSNEAEIPSSKEPTIAGSHIDDEKAVNKEEVVSPSVAEGPPGASPPDIPPRATGFRFALIFVGYVRTKKNVDVCVKKWNITNT